MKQRLPMFIIVLGVIVTGSVLWHHFAARDAQPARTLAGNGVIEATEVDVTAEVPGTLQTLVPHAGDEVQKGQRIAELSTGSLQGQVEQAQASLQSAQANLAELLVGTRREDILRAQAQYMAAEKSLQQAHASRSLVYAGARTELIAQLRAAYAQASAQFSQLKDGPRAEEIAQLQAAYAQAVAQRDLLRAGPRAEELAQLHAALAQAQAQMDLVKAGPRQEDIAELRAGYASAQASLADAETELKRMTLLASQGAVARRSVDQQLTARAVAQENAKAAKARLDAALAGARPQEIQEAESGLAQARQKLTEAENGARPQELASADQTVEIARQRLLEAKHGARPQEILASRQQVEVARQQLAQALAGARPQEREQADDAIATAQAQRDAAKAAYDLALAGSRPEDIAAARAKVEQAKGALHSAVTVRGQTCIYAPESARVTQRNLEPGDLVTPGTPIVQLAELNQVWLRVYVPETQVGLVKVGQRARVTTDAYGGKAYAGKVTEIAEEPEFTPKNIQTKEERVKLVFGVKITIDNTAQELKPGMPADALIYTR